MSGINPSHPVTIAGKKYKLRYTIHAADVIEKLTGQPFIDLVDEWGQETVAFGKALTLVWAGLLFHHKDLDRDEFGEMITARDLFDPSVQEAIVVALNDFFPEAPKNEEEPESPPAKKGKVAGGRGKR